jgi:hypothetical protein
LGVEDLLVEEWIGLVLIALARPSCEAWTELWFVGRNSIEMPTVEPIEIAGLWW